MEACWPSGVGPAGVGVKPPGAALAEDRRGERSGRRLGLTRSGGDQEGVPEASGWACCGPGVVVEASNRSDGIETGEYLRIPGTSGGCRGSPWPVVSGVWEAARAWSAALARNVRRRALEAAVRAFGSVRRAARGSVPTAETGGIEYRLRRSLADRLVVAGKPLLAGVAVERRGRLTRNVHVVQPADGREEAKMNKPKPKQDKPFAMPRQVGLGGVPAGCGQQGCPRGGRAGLGGVRGRLEGNLYKIWDRMSSGSYFPPPVRAVEIPKPHSSGTRMLGVPTIANRIAQSVVAAIWSRWWNLGSTGHSYGYRPGRSAHDALAGRRQRCRKYDWTIDLDVQKFFDTVPLGPRGSCGVVGDRLPVGAAVCQAVAGCAAAAPRRHAFSARQGNPTRIGDLAEPGEPAHALRVESVRWPGSSRAAQSSATPTTRSCIARRDIWRNWCWSGSPRGWRRWGYSSPGQDEDRLLQGQQSSG